MNDRVDRAMQEVWDWKRRTEEATRGMSGPSVIEFHRTQAAEVERKFGLNLICHPAADARRIRHGS